MNKNPSSFLPTEAARVWRRYLQLRAQSLMKNEHARYCLPPFLWFQWEQKLAWNQVSRKLLEDYSVQPGYNRNRFLTLRHWLGFLYRHEVLAVDWRPEVLRPIFKPKRLLQIPTHSEVMQLLNSACLEEPKGLRDRAMWELAYGSGLRAQEMASLDLGDLDLGGGFMNVRKTKNGFERRVPLTRWSIHYLQRYLQEVRPDWVTQESGLALWLNNMGRRISRRGSTFRIHDQGISWGLHRLRHACATRLLEGGANLIDVKILLGHKSLISTQIYTHVSLEHLRKMQQKYHPHSPLVEKKKESPCL